MMGRFICPIFLLSVIYSGLDGSTGSQTDNIFSIQDKGKLMSHKINKSTEDINLKDQTGISRKKRFGGLRPKWINRIINSELAKSVPQSSTFSTLPVSPVTTASVTRPTMTSNYTNKLTNAVSSTSTTITTVADTPTVTTTSATTSTETAATNSATTAIAPVATTPKTTTTTTAVPLTTTPTRTTTTSVPLITTLTTLVTTKQATTTLYHRCPKLENGTCRVNWIAVDNLCLYPYIAYRPLRYMTQYCHHSLEETEITEAVRLCLLKLFDIDPLHGAKEIFLENGKLWDIVRNTTVQDDYGFFVCNEKQSDKNVSHPETSSNKTGLSAGLCMLIFAAILFSLLAIYRWRQKQIRKNRSETAGNLNLIAI